MSRYERLESILHHIESIARDTGDLDLHEDVQDLWEEINKLIVNRPNVLVGSVAGVSFQTSYPSNLHALSEKLSGHPEGLKASLRRDPANQYDFNAVAFLVDGEMIGHLPREFASQVAPLLDNGVSYDAVLSGIRISEEAPNNPGADFRLTLSDQIVHIEEQTTKMSQSSKKSDGNPWAILDEKPITKGLSRKAAMSNPRAAFAERDRLKKVAEEGRKAEKDNNPFATTWKNADGTESPF